MKKKLSLFLVVLLLMGQLTLPVYAEESLPTESSAPTEPSKPAESIPVEPSKPAETMPTQPTESTTAPTEEQKPCTHVYGDWTADEAAHGRKCTLCGYAESNAHTWASETITVAPTCKDVGGVCKICTVCQGVLVTEIIPQTAEHSYDNDCDESCNVCGAAREVTHSYGTGWTYSYKGHWHKCSICGAAGELKSHYPGPAATEEKDQICLTCGYIMTKKLQHTHQYSSEWSSDSTGHWRVCAGCQEKDQFSAHSYNDTCDKDCNDCGYAREAAHEYGAWLSDETAHWQVCALCGTESPREDHDSGQDSICSVCLYALAIPHEHEYRQDWKCDASVHWKECDCGEKTETEAHLWDEGREEGNLKVFTCEVCRAEKQEEAPEKGFSWILILAGSGMLVCTVGIVACIIVGKKKGSFAR